MERKELLKNIAETAYNVGFGAKKHFATFDIVDKTPGLIGFFSTAFGTYALVFDELSTKFLSASFVVIGVMSIYISFYDSKKDAYEEAGICLTKLLNELRKLYSCTKHADDINELSQYEIELKNIENQYYESSISKQILFSDWFAHYKFFWQLQIDWIDEQKQFKLFRDKIPLTFSVSVLLVFVYLMRWVYVFLHKVC
jgi:SMODS and SLOG-associating 2TM effector domain 6